MSANAKPPMTPAIRVLLDAGVAFTSHEYTYEERGGTAVSSRELGVDEHGVIKTLVFEDDTGKPFIILMHGDREVSAKRMARVLGVKAVAPCAPAVAERHTGYRVGGTSPFATRKAMPVYAERSLTALPRILINGGRRGFLVGLAPSELVRILQPTLVDVAT